MAQPGNANTYGGYAQDVMANPEQYLRLSQALNPTTAGAGLAGVGVNAARTVGSAIPVVGGAVDAVGDFLGIGGGGGNKPKKPKRPQLSFRDRLDNALNATGWDAQQRDPIMSAFETLKALNPNTHKGRRSAFRQAKGLLVNKLNEGLTGGNSLDKGLAAQALMAQFMGPITSNLYGQSNAQAAALEGMQGLPPEMAGYAKYAGASQRRQGADMAATFAAQLAGLAPMQALQQQQSQDAQLAQQAYQAQLQGQDSGGSQSLTDAFAAAGAGGK